MTVSGVTMTSDARHPDQNRASMTRRQWSVFASRTRGGRMRCSTSHWCRKAEMSRWSAARERAQVRSVSRSERSTGTMARKVTTAARNFNCRNKNGLFSRHR